MKKTIIKQFSVSKAAHHIQELLRVSGEDIQREGLVKTPLRVAKAYEYFFKGYHEDPEAILKKAVFCEEYSEIVMVKDIDFYSLCEHHMLPFYGKIHVGYIPRGRLVGLSKIPRLVEVFSRRLQIQERLTNQIAETFDKVLNPLGVGVVVEAFHFCIAMRGVEKQNAFAKTSSMLGVFRDNRATRMEFMELLKK